MSRYCDWIVEQEMSFLAVSKCSGGNLESREGGFTFYDMVKLPLLA